MPSTDSSTHGPRWLLFLGLVLLALNLRPATVDVTPVLTEAAAALGLDAVATSLLTSIPVLCFGVFAAAGPSLIHRFGVHRTGLGVAVVATVALAGRFAATTGWAFLTWTVVVMAALGVGNVLLPAIVKHDFGNRIGLATASYTTALTLGITGASLGSAPIAGLYGWHDALLPALFAAVAAVVVWAAIVAVRHGRDATGTPVPERRVRLGDIARTRIGRLLVGLFACQAGLAFSVFGWLPTLFRDAGLDAVASGSLLGYVNLVGLALAFPIPAYLGRHPHAYWVVLVVGAAGLLAIAGLLVAPAAVPLVWATLLAVGLAGFPVFLTLLSLRARTAGGTAVLSAFAQSGGFLIAAPMPMLTGLLHSLTGSWTAPLLVWTCLLVGMTAMAVLSLRAGHVEDEWGERV
ncbi:MFS transporter [Propionicicella superfundia]|uniref:MFS transporter n=1 Tax=Propionicicella superfundia TaxID=348582 RepID=UPI0004255EE6|nr:MFS transporter [Propionicicella superfundia]